MSEREDKSSKWEPTYPPDLHPDVVGECRKTWDGGRPWTHLKVLRKGVDNSEGRSCDWVGGCPRPVEAVQYTSAFGDPQFYCADHAVEQEGIDTIHYDSEPKPEVPLTEEQKAFIERLLRPKRKREEKEDEYEP